jgi:predicted dehydrogenase
MMASATPGAGLPLRAAVVGCGHIATAHLAVLRRLRGVRIVGVCDLDPAAAHRAAALAGGCAAYTELRSLLDQARPDVVHVLTPPTAHRQPTLDAIEAGCHVLVEKPMAVTTGEAEEMLEAARAAGRQLCVAHNFLFEPGVQRAQAMAAGGALGRVTAVEIFWRVLRSDESGGAPGWVHGLRGGIFQEVAPHAVYLVDALLPGPRVAAALASGVGPASPGPEELRVLFDAGSAVGSVAISVASRPHMVTLTIHGTRRSVLVDLTTNVLVRLRKPGVGRLAKLATIDWSGQFAGGLVLNAVRRGAGLLPDGRRALIRRFYSSLRDGGPPPVSPASGVRTVALLDEVWRAISAPAGLDPG